VAKKKIVILGSSFAGFTAAMEIKKRAPEHDVVVISKSREFLFMPSLIWVPFGLRKREDITFDVAPIFEKKDVRYVEAAITKIDPVAQRVTHGKGEVLYDYLVIATGPELDYAAIPGFGPEHGFVESIFGFDAADHARVAFEAFKKDPGPVLIGGVPGASCFGAAYEFLFNMAHQLNKAGLRDKAPLTYVTAEPFLAHFGIGGFGNGTKLTEMFMKHAHVSSVVDIAVKEFQKGEAILEDGRSLPFKYAMFAPAFRGIAPVRALTEITDARGFVKTEDTYRTTKYPNIYAAGIAVALPPPSPTRLPCGVPKTGYASEEMARLAAHNILADIEGHRLVSLAPGAIDAKCVLDAGNNGMIMTADHLLEPRDHAWLIPGPEAHWAKLAFEKYFLATHRAGYA
jgi:sulfide:quinone oxidoreductase